MFFRGWEMIAEFDLRSISGWVLLDAVTEAGMTSATVETMV